MVAHYSTVSLLTLFTLTWEIQFTYRLIICLFCLICNCPIRIWQAVEHPNQSQQNLLYERKEHLVLCVCEWFEEKPKFLVEYVFVSFCGRQDCSH